MASNRDAGGRFTTGTKPGPGRSASWSTLIKRALTSDRRQAIVDAAVSTAVDGCHLSRTWLQANTEPDQKRSTTPSISSGKYCQERQVSNRLISR